MNEQINAEICSSDSCVPSVLLYRCKLWIMRNGKETGGSGDMTLRKNVENVMDMDDNEVQRCRCYKITEQN